jgi:hypothetical protein
MRLETGTTGTPEIQLIRGSGTDGNLDYYISNDGTFRITSSIDGTATDRLVIFGGRVGIGTSSPASSKIHIVNSSTTSSPDAGGNSVCFYAQNPTNTTGQNSVIFNRIAGTTAGKVMYSLAVGTTHGFCMYMTGVSSSLRFNNNSTATGTDVMVITSSGNLSVSGTKSWKIKHPILEGKDLLHVCVEAPRADNIYRGRKKLINGECVVNIDLECNTTGGMTDGTFELINKNIQVFVNNNETFDRVIGKVVGNKLNIKCENANAECYIDWLVIGERNDNEIINNSNTSSSGSIIVEVDSDEPQIQETSEPEGV